MTVLLAGDIGATKADLAVFSAEGGARDPRAEATLASADYPSLEALLRSYLEGVDVSVERASLAVAGPVINGRAHMTNLDWTADEQDLAGALGLSSVDLLNDLVATATCVPHLDEDDLHTLSAGEELAGGAIAVIAPGTGLGEAFLTWHDDHYVAHATEGGHTDFAPNDEIQDGLLRYLREQHGHVSYERVCCGMGLPDIYTYLKSIGYAKEPDWLRERLSGAEDPNPIIVEAAMDTDRLCPLCRAVLDVFVSVLGAEAGNLALKVLATGGVYLGGGIPPRILPILEGDTFIDAFLGKGRLAPMLARVPVRVILNPDAALLGAAYYGLAQV